MKASFLDKIKTIYIILSLIVFIALGVLVTFPEVIPSWVAVQQIVVLVLYVFNIVFAYVIIVRLWYYLKNSYSRKTSQVATILMATFITGCLFFTFIFTSLEIGQGFMGGTLAKKLDYPEHKVKLYLYDEGFLDVRTTVKIKHKFWPIMEDLAFIDDCSPYELNIYKSGDTVKFSAYHIIVSVDLINKNAEKTFLDSK